MATEPTLSDVMTILGDLEDRLMEVELRLNDVEEVANANGLPPLSIYKRVTVLEKRYNDLKARLDRGAGTRGKA